MRPVTPAPLAATLFTFALALAPVAGLPMLARAAPPADNPYRVALAPAERFDAGSTLVERHGQRGSPLILIPGLGGGAWVWQDAVRQLSGTHVVYVLTLAGFDGRPLLSANAGNALDAAQQSLQQLIVSRKLARPVLIGHSMGGTIALAFAERHSDLLGGVIAIDGLPVFPGTEDMPPTQRPQMVAAMKARLAAGRQDYAARQQQYMRGIGVTDMSMADELAQLSAKSDPDAVAEYTAETLALDLRAGLPDIRVPVLLIAPYSERDEAQGGLTRDAKLAYYKALMAGTPTLEVMPIEPSRHFVMFDQPQAFADAVRAYLKAL
jgi:pimeloyl-ACP methyl ester carboxylesterase